MPEATLLPPPPASLFDDDDGDDTNTSTSRTLEGLGASAVLGAMVEQRRLSRSGYRAGYGPRSAPEYAPECAPECAQELAPHATHEGGADHEARVVTKSGPVRRHSEGFLKVR